MPSRCRISVDGEREARSSWSRCDPAPHATVSSPSREDIRSLETGCREPRTHSYRHRGALRPMHDAQITLPTGELIAQSQPDGSGPTHRDAFVPLRVVRIEFGPRVGQILSVDLHEP